MSVVHVFTLMDSKRWTAGQTQFRFHGATPWTDQESLTIDEEHLRAMIALAASAGVSLRGRIYDIARLLIDAQPFGTGKATLGSVIHHDDFGPCVLLTTCEVLTRPELESYLDLLPHEDLMLAHALGRKLHGTLRKVSKALV